VAFTRFYSVSCTSTRACTAVGYRSSPDNARTSLSVGTARAGASSRLRAPPAPC
jgi:hypothetical protein